MKYESDEHKHIRFIGPLLWGWSWSLFGEIHDHMMHKVFVTTNLGEYWGWYDMMNHPQRSKYISQSLWEKTSTNKKTSRQRNGRFVTTFFSVATTKRPSTEGPGFSSDFLTGAVYVRERMGMIHFIVIFMINPATPSNPSIAWNAPVSMKNHIFCPVIVGEILILHIENPTTIFIYRRFSLMFSQELSTDRGCPIYVPLNSHLTPSTPQKTRSHSTFLNPLNSIKSTLLTQWKSNQTPLTPIKPQLRPRKSIYCGYIMVYHHETPIQTLWCALSFVTLLPSNPIKPHDQTPFDFPFEKPIEAIEFHQVGFYPMKFPLNPLELQACWRSGNFRGPQS